MVSLPLKQGTVLRGHRGGGQERFFSVRSSFSCGWEWAPACWEARLAFSCSLALGQVSPEKCRFAIGRILSEGDAKPTEEQIRQFQKYGFKIFSFPTPSHVVMASFPFTTPLSIHLAINRVHPALDTYIKVSGVRGTPRSCQHPASS